MVEIARRRHRPHEEEESYFISMSDMMVGLLFIFIIMLIYFAMQYRQTTNQLTGANETRAKILHELKESLEKQGVQVTVDEKTGVLRLPEEVLFNRGQYILSEDGRSKVSIVASEMAKILPCYTDSGDSPDSAHRCSPHHIDAIFVEGHTDKDPMRGGMDNWDLSVQRATNTYRQLISTEPNLAGLKSVLHTEKGDKMAPIFGVSGYGPGRPVDDGDTDDAKRMNRRIDLRFLMTSPPADLGIADILVKRP